MRSSGITSAAFLLLTGCTAETGLRHHDPSRDTAAVVFGPSLTELFFAGGIGYRLAAVDRHSEWPSAAAALPRAGDFLSPSLEVIAAVNATSIHVVGNSTPLRELSARLEIPLYTYSFDTLDDIQASASAIEELYPDADLSPFTGSVRSALDSLAGIPGADTLTVMTVIYLEEDGAITLAGEGTFFHDILLEAGCLPLAPKTGSYPSVSVEGVLAMDPDRVLILSPGSEPEDVISTWTSGGLSPSGVSVLTGDHILIPGSRLPLTIREMGSCLN